MASTHPSFTPPNDKDSTIWRYMSLTKFLLILDSQSLWFSAPSKFEDPFECSFPKAAYVVRDDQQVSDEQLAEAAASWAWVREHAMKNTFINCWHMNDAESDAMWKLYGLSREGIAIRSTYQKLFDALPTECAVGSVKYIDYATETFEPVNLFNFTMHKRKAFSHEREVRASIASTENEGAPGISIPISPNDLIEAICLSPGAHPSFKKLVENILSANTITCPVEVSRLDDKPSFNISYERMPPA